MSHVLVEYLNVVRVEKLNRVKLVEKEKDDLEPAMKAALGFIKLENEKTDKLFRQSSRYILDSEKNIEKANEKKSQIEESASDLTDKLKEVTGRRKEKEADIIEKGKDFDKVQKEIESYQESFKKLELEDTTLREELKSTNARRKKVKAQVEKEKENKEKYENMPAENQKKIDECQELREKLEKKVADEEENYETAMATLKTDTQVYQDEKAEHESKLVDLKKAVNEAASELDLATTEHTVYTSAEVKAKNRLEELNNRIENQKASVRDKAAKLAELEETIPGKEQEFREAEAELKQVSGAAEKASSHLYSMKAEYQEKRSAQQQSKSIGKVGDALMEQKNRGNIPGIIGRLGDLGGIDKKYDIAISTAAGGFLDQILVDDNRTGQQCIEFLRKHNIGRGNFLALNRCTGSFDRQMQPIQTPQNVPRLFDLIEADDKYLPAFYKGVRDTLVATDIDQARQVAYGAKRFRVVTLDGQLVETSGTMSGGGRPSRGKMGQQSAQVDKISPKEFEKMERSIAEVEEEARGADARKQELDEFIYTTKKELQDMKKQLGKLKVEVNPLKEEVTMLERQVADQEVKVRDAAPDKNVVKKMQARIDKAQGVYDDANENAQVVERDVKACDAKIKEITGGKIKSIQKKLEDSKKQLEKVKTEITRLGVEIKSSERNLKKCMDKMESYEAEVKECEEKMRGIAERRKEIETEGAKVLEENEERQKSSNELQGTINSIKKEIDQISKEETELKSNRIEVDQQLQKWDDAIKDNSKKVSYWKREIKKLSLQDVPGEEVTPLPELSEEDILAINMEELKFEIATIDENLAKSKPNMAAIAEYKKKEEVRDFCLIFIEILIPLSQVYLERVNELDKITGARDEQRKHHDDLRKQRLNDFMEG